MEKRSILWLKDFKFVYKPSKSFLNCMNNALQKEYSTITGKEFNIIYLFIENPSDLIYLPTEYAAVLKASIEVQQRSYWGNCTIGWRTKTMDYIIKPENEVKEDDIEFKWIELSIPILPQPLPVESTLVKRLGFTLNYELINSGNTDSQDIEFYIRLKNPSVLDALNQQLYSLQKNWNEQNDQDINRQNGYIHWLSFEREEDGKYIFRIDVGSSGDKGLKQVLAEFNSSKWGITQVEMIYI